jgi:hypothetical protein
MSTSLVDIDVFIHAETTKAVFVSRDGEESTAVWLAKSLIEIERKRGKLAVVTAPEWLALREGLI